MFASSPFIHSTCSASTSRASCLSWAPIVGLKTGGRHGVPGVYDVKLGLCLLDQVNGSPSGESGVLGAVAGQQDLRGRKGHLMNSSLLVPNLRARTSQCRRSRK